MEILLIFTLYFIKGQVDSAEITGYAGGSVLINCKYDPMRYMNHIKFFCKLDGRKECTGKILSKAQNVVDREGKFFMNAPGPGMFSVLIKAVSQQDSGVYRCGVEDGDKPTDVTLTVKEDPCCGKSQVQKVQLGETVTFTCAYPEEFKHHFKYMYKVTNHSCHVIIFTLGQSDQQGRFSLFDRPEDKHFNMSIRNVTEEDGGEYLCGVQGKKDGNQEPYYFLFNEMQLRITDGHPAPSSPGSPIIIPVCICVSLLLVGGLVLIFYKLRHKTKGSASSASYRRNPQNNEVHQTPAYYEEIPDLQRSTNTVYATTQKPTASHDVVNRTAEPSTDLSNSDFYTLAQLSNHE